MSSSIQAGSGGVPFIAPAAGCGFALAFGWLWFPGLRDVLLPCLAGTSGSGRAFSLTAFGVALAAGFLLEGFFAGRLKAGAALLLSHLCALILLGLALLCRMAASSAVPAGLPEVSFGLGAALPGVWWTGRLLALGPVRAAAALAWAALAALPLIFALSLFPEPLSPLFAACAVAAGIALALPPALPVLFQSRASSLKTGSIVPLPSLLSAAVPGLRGVTAVAALFFGLGSLNILAPQGADILSGFAQACGAVLAAALFAAQSKNSSRRGLRERFTSGGSWRATGLAACSLTVAAMCLPLFPEAAAALFHACSGAAEAAALVLASSVCLEPGATGGAGEKAAPPGLHSPWCLYPRWCLISGLFLVLALTLVNGGGLAGRELQVWAGAFGPALPGLAAAGLLAATAWRENRQAAPGLGAESDSPEPVVWGGEPIPRDTPIPPDIALQLTGTEQAMALLLLQGHSNKAIAKSLKLTENTIRWHIKKLNKKLGTQNRAALLTSLGGWGKKDEA